jgi:hypothetical protein
VDDRFSRVLRWRRQRGTRAPLSRAAVRSFLIESSLTSALGRSAGMEEAGPFAIVATFCESVLREVDGRATVVRIFDGVEFQIDSSRDLPESLLQKKFFVSLRGGAQPGPVTLRLQFVTPSGVRAPEFLGQLTDSVPGGGMDWEVNLTIVIREDGLHWMEVGTVERGPLTRVPLRVTISRQKAQTPGTSETDSQRSGA